MRYLNLFERFKLSEAIETTKNKDNTKKASTGKKSVAKASINSIESLKGEYSNLLANIQKETKIPVVSTSLAKQTLDVVKFLQAFLKLKGNVLKIDGQYGESSKKAMANFQNSVSLTPDGICGSKTWQNILREFGQDASNYTIFKVDADNSSTHVNTITNGSLAKISKKYEKLIELIKNKKALPILSSKLVKQKLQEVSLLQDYLEFTKYSEIKADGQFGDKTSTAVKKLQSKYNLKEDGIVGLKTWAIVLKDFGFPNLNDYTTTTEATNVASSVPVSLSSLKSKYIAILNQSQKDKKLPLLSVTSAKIKSDYVSLVQDYLCYKKIKTVVDGKFNDATKRNVIKWQKNVKTTADGAVGLKSWTLIMKDFNFSIDNFTTYTLTEKVLPQKTTATTTTTITAPADQTFYTLTTEQDAQFAKTTFRVPDGEIIGEKLADNKYMKTSGIAELIKLNPDKAQVSLILKKAYVLMGKISPIKLIMQYPGLREETTTPILRLQEPRLAGELVYYGLRGLGNDKGISMFVTRRILIQLASWSTKEKLSLENWFNKYAQNGDLAKYRDTTKYPLRKWLYDQFKEDDPYKWMNHITEDSYNAKLHKRMPTDALDDKDLYPRNKEA